jgi:hypothetical protein
MSDKPNRPNEEQVMAADAVFKQAMTQGPSQPDSARRRALFSILSCLTGMGQPADEFHGAINDALGGIKVGAVNDGPYAHSGGAKASRTETGGNAATNAALASNGPATAPAGASPAAIDAAPSNRPEEVQQLGAKGDTQVHPEGRPDPGVDIQSWPPTGADLELFTVDALKAMLVPELVDYARPAGIEGYETMEHDELVQALFNAAHGIEADADDADEDEGDADEADEDDTDDADEADADLPEDAVTYTKEELRGMTLAEIKDIAGDLEIEGRSSMAKADLINAIAKQSSAS